jgi:hypothetical protein
MAWTTFIVVNVSFVCGRLQKYYQLKRAYLLTRPICLVLYQHQALLLKWIFFEN